MYRRVEERNGVDGVRRNYREELWNYSIPWDDAEDAANKRGQSGTTANDAASDREDLIFKTVLALYSGNDLEKHGFRASFDKGEKLMTAGVFFPGGLGVFCSCVLLVPILVSFIGAMPGCIALLHVFLSYSAVSLNAGILWPMSSGATSVIDEQEQNASDGGLARRIRGKSAWEKWIILIPRKVVETCVNFTGGDIPLIETQGIVSTGMMGFQIIVSVNIYAFALYFTLDYWLVHDAFMESFTLPPLLWPSFSFDMQWLWRIFTFDLEIEELLPTMILIQVASIVVAKIWGKCIACADVCMASIFPESVASIVPESVDGSRGVVPDA
jgi:hypothetical protein